MLLKNSYNKIIKYRVIVKCTEPLHIGSAAGGNEEVLVHPIEDVPFIQASSIAGVFREYCRQTYGERCADEIFGARKFEENANASEGGSRIRFTDGMFEKKGQSLKLELRPRVSINPETGTCAESQVNGTNRKSGHKFNMEYISAGAEAAFSVYLFEEQYQKELEDAFAAVNQGIVQIGGQKSNGCGYLEVKKIWRKAFDMTKLEDRNLWYKEEELEDREYEDLTGKLKTDSRLKNAYEITVTGRTEGQMLIKSIAVSEFNSDTPDCENIRNGNGDYIIPGSSFKGAVRAQMNRIVNHLEKEYPACKTIMENSFGKVSAEDKKGRPGNLFFFDTVVEGKETKTLLSYRIHIDKFTGGVMHGSLFDEKNIAGEMTLHITIKDRNLPDRTCAVLLMALRDLAAGMINLGGGYGIGKGFLTVDEIIVEDKRKPGVKAVINFKENKIFDKNSLISACFRSLQEGGDGSCHTV